jgi:hypothetical protein
MQGMMLNFFRPVNFPQSVFFSDKPNKSASPSENSTRHPEHSKKRKYRNWYGLGSGNSDGDSLFQEYKAFQLMSRLKGAALCDIKTRFTVKKRNPE